MFVGELLKKLSADCGVRWDNWPPMFLFIRSRNKSIQLPLIGCIDLQRCVSRLRFADLGSFQAIVAVLSHNCVAKQSTTIPEPTRAA
jgi:hypothetical protein